MKTFGQFAQQLNEASGLFGGDGKHLGDDVVFIEGPYRKKGSWTIASFDTYSDIFTAEQDFLKQGYEVVSRWKTAGQQLSDNSKPSGNKGRIVVLEGDPKLIVVIYSTANASPGKFGMGYSTSSESMNIKPQSLGIQETPYSVGDLVQTVVDALDSRDDLGPAVTEYLVDLLEYYWNAKDSKIAAKIKQEHVPAIAEMGPRTIGQITKNFGEIIGPIAILHRGSPLFSGLKLNSRHKILFPLRGNEPLVDFYILKGDQKIPFSAKSGKDTTNTVKPNDVIRLMSEDPKALRKWGKSPETEVLRHLHENSAVDGPIVAAFNIKNSIKEFKKLTQEVVDHWTSNSARYGKNWRYDPKIYDDFVTQLGLTVSARKKPTFGEILYKVETIICKQSAGGILEYTEMFNDVIGPAVNYINLMSIDKKTGLPQWSTSEGGEDSVKLRTKNGNTRIGKDKIGIQIKQS
jgi:hypothetical protein